MLLLFPSPSPSCATRSHNAALRPFPTLPFSPHDGPLYNLYSPVSFPKLFLYYPSQWKGLVSIIHHGTLDGRSRTTPKSHPINLLQLIAYYEDFNQKIRERKNYFSYLFSFSKQSEIAKLVNTIIYFNYYFFCVKRVYQYMAINSPSSCGFQRILVSKLLKCQHGYTDCSVFY